MINARTDPDWHTQYIARLHIIIEKHEHIINVLLLPPTDVIVKVSSWSAM